MDFDDVVLGRKSIRGYRSDPVSKALIEEILALAMRAPSSLNMQGYHFYVIAGEPLERIRRGNMERMLAGVAPSREFRPTEALTEVHRERQVRVAKQIFAAMDIARGDAIARAAWRMRGFRQFDAPVCIIIAFDRSIDGTDDASFDCGGVATMLANAAWSRGLGTVINSQGIMHSPLVREAAGVSPDHVILKSIAMGWPDNAFPANAIRSDRRTVSDATSFVGFDEA